MLPDIFVPYKQYGEEIIAGCLDGIVQPTDADSEDYPSEATIKRWNAWLMINRLNINGHLRSIGYRVLGFQEELLDSTVSLLEYLQNSIPDGWLRIILRFIYNSGNSLQPVY